MSSIRNGGNITIESKRYILALSMLMVLLNVTFASIEGSEHWIERSRFPLWIDGPITIDGDQSLLDLATSEGFTGTGQYLDPILIEGITLDAGGDSFALRILNLTLYVMIKDSTISNATGSGSPGNGVGLDIFNCSDAVRILNTTFKDCNLGLRIRETDEMMISQSDLKKLGTGIDAQDCTLSVRSTDFSDINGPGVTMSMGAIELSDGRMTNCSSLVSVSNLRYVEMVKNIAMDTGGFYIYSSRNVNITENSINSSRSWSFLIYNCQDVLSRDNVISKGRSGFYISQSSNVRMESDEVLDCDMNGIEVSWSSSMTISNSTIHTNQYGINVNRGNGLVINGNDLRFNINDGIRVRNSDAVKIRDNLISHGLRYGILGEYVDSFEVLGNHIERNNIHGISMDHCEYPIIWDNTILYHQNGLDMRYSDGIHVQSNRLFGNYIGIALYDLGSSRINGNIIDTSRSYGILLSGSNGNLVTNNSIQKGKTYGIYAQNSNSNLIITNAFLENNGVDHILNSSRVQAACANGDNEFYNISTGGNYWRDHTTPDSDQDGIVDDPYPVDGGLWDMYPLSDPPFPVVPGPVRSLICYPSGNRSVLEWSPPVHVGEGPLVGFRIYRKEGGTYVPLTDVGPDSNKYVDPGLVNGRTYYYEISAVNVIGEGPISSPVLCIPDNVPPSILVDSPVDGSYTSSDHVDLIWYGWGDPWESAEVLFDVYLDEEPFMVAGTSTYLRIGPLEEGGHSILIDAYDAADNHNITKIAFIVDSTAPSIEITHPLNGSYLNTKDITVSYDIQDENGLSSVMYALNGGFYKEITEGLVLEDLREGRYVLNIEASDTAGNVMDERAIFFIDLTLPTASISGPANNSIINENTEVFTIETNDSSGIKEIRFSISQGPWTSVGQQEEFTITGLAEGKNDIRIAIIDMATNELILDHVLFVDTILPSVIDRSPNGTDNPVDVGISVRFSERMDRDSIRVQITDSSPSLYWSGELLLIGTYTPLEYDHGYTVDINGEDLAGNPMEPYSWTFRTTDKGTIKGVVQNANRIGISDVLVRIDDGRSTSTGEDGRFEFVVSKGDHDLTFSKDGFQGQSRNVEGLNPGQIRDLGIIVLEVESTRGSIKGKVIDDHGDAILGVFITTDTGETDTSDEEGLFSFDCEAGPRTISFQREGYVNVSRTIDVPLHGTVDIGDVRMSSIDTEGASGDSIPVLYLQIGIFLVLMVLGSALIIIRIRSKKKGALEE